MTVLLVVAIVVVGAAVGIIVGLLRPGHDGHHLLGGVAGVLILIGVLVVVLAIAVPCFASTAGRTYARLLQYGWGQRRRVGKALRKARPIAPEDPSRSTSRVVSHSGRWPRSCERSPGWRRSTMVLMPSARSYSPALAGDPVDVLGPANTFAGVVVPSRRRRPPRSRPDQPLDAQRSRGRADVGINTHGKTRFTARAIGLASQSRAGRPRERPSDRRPTGQA